MTPQLPNPLEGRAAMREALEETPVSLELAAKLDALTDAEWDELTRWLATRTKMVARAGGIVITNEACLARAHWRAHSNVVLRALHPNGELRRRSDELAGAIFALLLDDQ